MRFNIVPELLKRLGGPGILLVLALVSQSCRQTGDPYNHMDAKIALEQADADNIAVRVSLTNTGTKIRLVPAWDLPADGQLSCILFEVSRDGEPLPYIGKRPEMTLNAFISIEPGKQDSVIIKLAQGYDVGPRGEYKISYHSSMLYRSWLGGTPSFPLKSNVLVVKK